MPQKLGQHFLNNNAVIQKIIAALELKSGETVIEIGPGLGALTLPLARICAAAGCTVVAVEKDPELAVSVQGLGFRDRLNVVTGDALKELPHLAKRYKLTANRFKLVGNIPYYITGHLLRVIGELKHKPSRTVLMIQKEVAERLTAKPGAMNLLAAATQIWADISIIATLKPGDFSPPPKVESAVVLLRHMANGEWRMAAEDYYYFIKAAFKQPRKTLLNNLSEGLERKKDELLEMLKKLGYTEKTRAAELSIDALTKLAGCFSSQ